MKKDYKTLFNNLITSKIDELIIKYDSKKDNYTYQGFSHLCDSTSLDELSNLVIDDIVFYTFSEEEILEYDNKFNFLDDLRSAAKYAYAQRLPQRKNEKTDGLLGEVLLDLFIQRYSLNAKKLVVRAKHTEIKSRQEITGYDALYFTKNKDEISFWLGQAKAGEKEYCKQSISKDLNEKYKKEYFANTAFYIADKRDTNELDDILVGINKICFEAQKNNMDAKQKINNLFLFLKRNNIKIKIPCMIAYTKDIYNDEFKLKQKVEQEVDSIMKYMDKISYSIDIKLEYEILFWILPVKNVSYIRNKLIDLKKEAI